MWLLIRVLSILFLSILAGLSWAFRYLDWPRIESILNAIPYRCPLKLFTGLECAFCGMTHSWISILRGEWAQSLQYNALGVWVFGLALLIAIAFAAGSRLDEKFNHRQKVIFSTIGLLVLSVYAIARNIHPA